MAQYVGKYRGTVFNNIDPMQMGRLQVIVPDVTSVLPSTWALPCLPMTGQQCGVFTVPPIGATVWVEFEHGDRDYPIWTGGFWGSAAEVPALALATTPPLQTIVLQTVGENTLQISDMPGPTGGILLKSATGALISITDTGITITNGQGATIMLTGPTVTVNEGALSVV
jgi:uncharacterized protein involved in type VI secretion and phage assembly